MKVENKLQLRHIGATCRMPSLLSYSSIKGRYCSPSFNDLSSGLSQFSLNFSKLTAFYEVWIAVCIYETVITLCEVNASLCVYSMSGLCSTVARGSESSTVHMSLWYRDGE